MIALQVDYLKGKIVASQAFYKKAQIVGTPEHHKLNRCRSNFPDYDLEIHAPKKCTQNRFTYTFMEEYIMTHETQETIMPTLDQFWELRQMAACYTKGTCFSIVKKWFLHRYPEVAMCGSTAQTSQIAVLEAKAA